MLKDTQQVHLHIPPVLEGGQLRGLLWPVQQLWEDWGRGGDSSRIEFMKQFLLSCSLLSGSVPAFSD